MPRPNRFTHPGFPHGVQGIGPRRGVREASLGQLSITADSVVVTVVVMPRPENLFARIHWGDDTSDLVDFRRSQLHTDPELPNGSFKLQHVYRKSAFGGAIPGRVIVIVAVHSLGGERHFEGRGIDLAPRYRCILYPTVVKANHHDTGLEEHSEFDVFMHVSQGGETLLDSSWRWEPKTFDIDGLSTTVGIVAERMLEESGVSTELTRGDPPVNVSTSYYDDDGWAGGLLNVEWNWPPYEFDGSATLPVSLDPRFIEGPFSFVWRHGTEGEFFAFHISGEMNLIVPIDRGPVVAPS